jgi:hypothetical protein
MARLTRLGYASLTVCEDRLFGVVLKYLPGHQVYLW